MKNKFVSYLKESRDELKKTVWPTRKEVIEMTSAVVIIVIFIGFLVGAYDYVLSKALTYILSLSK